MTTIVEPSNLLEALLKVEAAEKAMRRALNIAISNNASSFEIFSYRNRLDKVREEHMVLLAQLDQLETEGTSAMVGFFTSLNRT